MNSIFKIRFPLDKEFIKDKKISDLLYTWLYYNSFYNKKWNTRYIEKAIINITKLSKLLKISRSTVYNYIDNLLSIGYLKENEDFESYVLEDISESYILVDSDIMEKLMDTEEKNIIKCYCILLKFYRTNNTNAHFTQCFLLDKIGYSNESGENYPITKNILNRLVKMKLLKYTTEYKDNEFVSKNIITYMK